VVHAGACELALAGRYTLAGIGITDIRGHSHVP
jgi:hypothetical protein